MEYYPLHKVFAGCFYMLDEKGEKTNYYKQYDLFRNTYGLAFFINTKTKGRGYVVYFGRDEKGICWNVRTVFPAGKVIEENDRMCLKTRYNTFVWDATTNPSTDLIESLYEWVKENGTIYVPGLKDHPGVTEYFERGHHF